MAERRVSSYDGILAPLRRPAAQGKGTEHWPGTSAGQHPARVVGSAVNPLRCRSQCHLAAGSSRRDVFPPPVNRAGLARKTEPKIKPLSQL